jgi:RimJ/RimL family protein N-acetyltransferase
MLIKTERLLLREFYSDDWQAVHAYHNDPRYLRYYTIEAESEQEARRFVQGWVAQQAEAPRLNFQLAIALPESGLLIGNVGLRLRWLGGHLTGSPQADIGYEVHPDYWGNGYASEAAQAMLDYGFGELGLHRIWAQCNAENRASARVLIKIGMRLEGVLREHDRFKGRWWDEEIYAILVHEWQAS